MEALNFNETNIDKYSHLNGSANVSHPEISFTIDDYCDFIVDVQSINWTLQLNQSAEYSLCYSTRVIRRVAFWLVLVIGIPGNILALLTILRFPRTTATFYLTLLTIFDLMALVTKATNVGMLTFIILDSVSCKLIIMLTNFTGTYANWILVLICFERFIAVLFPLKKNFYFTMRRAHLSAVIVAVVIFLCCSVYLWIMTADIKMCVPTDQNVFNTLNLIMTVIYSYLPSVLLGIMVGLIWRELKKIQRIREYIFCGEEGSSAVALTQQRLQEQAKTERSITIMLLFAAIIFVLLTIPICVVLAVSSSEVVGTSNYSHLCLHLFTNIARSLVLSTHAVNFFVYFLSTERFRRHFRQLFRCLPKDRKLSYNEKTISTVEDQL